MSDLIKEMRSFQLYPDHYLRLGADEIERLTAKHKNSFEAGWTMYADNSLGPRVPDQMEQAWNHYLEKQSKEDSGT